MPTCYLVLGTPRSGTSLVAGLLFHLGIKMGMHNPDAADNELGGWDFMPPSEWNPKGFFQDSGFVNFAGKVYGWRDAPVARELMDGERKELTALIQSRAEFGVVWGVKDPHISLYLKEFVAACPHPVKVITTRRERAKSVDSWKARANCGDEEAAKRIDTIANALQGIAPDLVIYYDHLLNAPAVTVENLASFLDREVTQAAIDFVDPSMRRH